MTALAGLFVARDPGGNGTTPKGARQALAGLLAKNADGTVKVGVLADGQGPVVTGAAGMTYNVRKHVAVTKASEANGPVLVPNDGTVSVTTDPAPGSNSRIDVIYILQPLVTGDGGSSSSVAPVIDVAKGAVAASPSAPAIPSGALELARVTVPSGTTATSGLSFTQGATTTTAGGVIEADWVPMTLDAGFTVVGGNTPQYRVSGASVYTRGLVTRTGGFPAGTYKIITPVDAMRPTGQDFHGSVATDSNADCRMLVTKLGTTASVTVVLAGTVTWVSLDSSWLLG